MTSKTEIFPKKTRNKYVYVIIGLTIFNIIAFTIVTIRNHIVLENYSCETIFEQLKLSALSVLFGLPIWSLLIACIVALFPYKNLTYKEKYTRSFLVTLRFINIVCAIGLILILILFLFGYPPAN